MSPEILQYVLVVTDVNFVHLFTTFHSFLFSNLWTFLKLSQLCWTFYNLSKLFSTFQNFSPLFFLLRFWRFYQPFSIFFYVLTTFYQFSKLLSIPVVLDSKVLNLKVRLHSTFDEHFMTVVVYIRIGPHVVLSSFD